MNKIAIIGTGGFAREIACLLADLNLFGNIKGFYEPHDVWLEKYQGKVIMSLPVKSMNDISDSDDVVIGIGNSIIREKIVNELSSKINYPTFIHPNAVVSQWCEIGNGCIITAGSILTCQIEIGSHSQLNLQTTIGHDTKIGNFFTSAPGVNISGICTFDEHVYFGTGAATRQDISICGNVTVGMGAMVTKNITESGIYVGIPAKKLNK